MQMLQYQELPKKGEEIMHDLYNLKDSLIKELGEYGKSEISMDDLKVIDTLAHAGKNVCKIIESVEEEMGGYSSRGNSYAMPYMGMSYAQGNNGGSSYARGRGRNANRDSMGRYSSADGMVPDLYELMENAGDDKTRQGIQRLINKMDNSMAMY